MKETVGIEILIRSMNIEETFFRTTRRPSKIIKEWNKLNPIQMNNFESSTCKKRLRLAIIWGRIKGWRELVSLGQQPQCTYYYSWSNSQVAARITSIKYDNSISWNVGCSNLDEKDTPSITPPPPPFLPSKKKEKKKETKKEKNIFSSMADLSSFTSINSIKYKSDASNEMSFLVSKLTTLSLPQCIVP